MNACCKTSLGAPVQARPDLTIRTCTVCNRRHFRLKADPGRIGATLKPLGK